MQVKFKKNPGCEDLQMPFYATAGSAGMDLLADVQAEGVIVIAGHRTLISCGFSMAIPEGYEAQIRPRSGLALKNGITVLNSPGTIDSDYRGVVGVIIYNSGIDDYIVIRGSRIAQMVFSTVCHAELIENDFLVETARGSSGYGSTGVAIRA